MQKNPCIGCTERFIACHDNCPKDARGEYGHKAWKADMHKAKAAEKAYKQARREDFLMSEQCTHPGRNFKRGNSNG